MEGEGETNGPVIDLREGVDYKIIKMIDMEDDKVA
jgi:hypothetical protein